ncbi:MAG: hypothetical protein KTR31_16700 [Myxococcales bacterium]|nr:hypothetical protein [Myxococcales bacterium]
MTRIAAWLSVPAGLLILGTACEIDAGAEDGNPPSILVTVGGHNISSNDPAPAETACYEVPDDPTRVNVVASDSGGLQRLFVHLLEGSVVDGVVDVRPDASDISWLVAPGESPADIGDDTIDITLTQPTAGTVRNGVNLTFDLEGGVPFSLETRASDYAGYETVIAPFVLHQVDVHGACP